MFFSDTTGDSDRENSSAVWHCGTIGSPIPTAQTSNDRKKHKSTGKKCGRLCVDNTEPTGMVKGKVGEISVVNYFRTINCGKKMREMTSLIS